MALKYQDILDKMTLSEKAHLCTGKDMWSTYDIERLHIPSMVTSDGPHGLRKQEGSDTNEVEFINGAPATCFPPSATMANSWDEALGEAVGEALGEEAVGQGVNVLLGPGLNIKRSPLCGRNFEYFSEDPYLSGKMAAAYVRGIQSQGVASCIKHFAANNQEFQRMSSNSVVDERALREIYTTGFEIAVTEGGPRAVMTSYNMVNGTYAFENRHLVHDILRGEWGFTGAVISDWGGCNDIVASLNAGSNLEMPGNGDITAREIIDAVENGQLSERVLDERIVELIDIVLWTDEFKRYSASYKDEDDITDDKSDNSTDGTDYEAHALLARRASRESIVLLKNEDNILPLKMGRSVAVIGQFAKNPRIQGGGSSIVTPIGEVTSVVNKIGGRHIDYVGYAEGYEIGGTINISKEEEAVELARKANTVLLFAGLDDYSESEGFDRDTLSLPINQESLIEKVCEVNENVIMILAGGSPFAMPWVNKVKGIVHGYLTGQEGADAILDVLTGAYNPSGKLAETYPKHLGDVACSNYYPGRDKDVLYKEGLFVGYRYYDTTDTEVLFPFGYGISYTTFQYGGIEADEHKVTFDITNTGDVAGAEIAQVYIGRDVGSVYRAKKELKGFSKVFLEPGETKHIEIELDDKAFRYYDVKSKGWITEPGTYTIYVASSVTEIRLQQTIDIGEAISKITKYFSADVTEITDEEYEQLYGGPISKVGTEDTGEVIIGRNDSISRLEHGKSLIGKVLIKYLKHQYKKSGNDINKKATMAGALDMPIRGIGKLSSGRINSKMVDSLVDVANGHTIKGIKDFLDEKKNISH